MADNVESSGDPGAQWRVEDGINTFEGGKGTTASHEDSELRYGGKDEGLVQETGKDIVEAGVEDMPVDSLGASQELTNEELTGIRDESKAVEVYISMPATNEGPDEAAAEEAIIRKDESMQAPVETQESILPEESPKENRKGEEEEEEEEEEDETIMKMEAENGNEDKEAVPVEAGASNRAGKKRKGTAGENGVSNGINTATKKSKKKNAWSKTSSRKGGKKQSSKAAQARNLENENSVYLCPTPAHMEKIEDGPSVPILLSRHCKAERVELSADRLSAGSTKGYRMVRATRGVVEGPWYFEIKVEKLGPTGHTRLGWCTQKADIQAPVGYDTYGYSYRDLEGSKVHAALREPYGEEYKEGDVIGFYIDLPNGAKLAPKPPEMVVYKGAVYYVETKEEPPQPVPDSEICFFKNGLCQGTAFKDILAGRYYPAASMYTLPNEPNCTVRFNFGPDFSFPPLDLGGRPVPQPMCDARCCDIKGQEIDADGNVVTPLSSLADNPRQAVGFTPDVSNGNTRGS